MGRARQGIGRWVMAAALAGAAQPALADEYPDGAAASEGAVRLQPIQPWNLDFAENRCRLMGLFGDKAAPHLLMFEQAAPSDEFGLTLAGPEFERMSRRRSFEVGAERDELLRELERFYHGEVNTIGQAVIVASYTIGEFGDAPDDADESAASDDEPAPLQLTAGAIDLEEAATIERFVIKGGKRVISFETGTMMPAFQALNVCTADLLRAWGLDPEEHKRYRPPRWTNQQAVVERIGRYYPSAALSRGEQGVYRMRVIVDQDGSISDCLLEQSTEMDTLKSRACREMQNAKFEPATGADGQPIRSFYATTISYIAD